MFPKNIDKNVSRLFLYQYNTWKYKCCHIQTTFYEKHIFCHDSNHKTEYTFTNKRGKPRVQQQLETLLVNTALPGKFIYYNVKIANDKKNIMKIIYC